MKNIIESFISIQGEGLRTGRPTLFIRLNGCNLRCVFRNGAGKVASCCDTPYASFEGSSEGKYTEDDVIKMFTDNPQVKDVVITGGEPLLNQASQIKVHLKAGYVVKAHIVKAAIACESNY